MYKTVDRNRRFLSGRDGIDDKLRSGDRVSSGKNIRYRRLTGHRIGLNGPRSTQTESDTAQVHFLSDSRQNRGGRNDLIDARSLHASPSLFVRFARFHFFQLQSADGRITEDFHRCRKTAEADSFCLCLFQLVAVCRHLRLTAPIIDRHTRAKTYRGTRHIHGYISSADHRDFIAKFRSLTLIDSLQEVHSAHASGQAFSGDLQL